MEEVDIYHASSEDMSNFLALFSKLISEGYHKASFCFHTVFMIY